MKTKELIKQLQEADPSGEIECCIENCDIHYVVKEPAYFDGRLQILTRDETIKCYNIIGAKYTSSGEKISIVPHSITNYLLNVPNGIVDYSEIGNDITRERYKRADDEARKVSIDAERWAHLSHFIIWAKEKAKEISGDLSNLETDAEEFFDKHLSANDLYPEDIRALQLSPANKRKLQWDREISLTYSRLDWIFEKKEIK